MLSQIEQNQEKKDERGNQLITSLQNKFSQYPELMEVASGSSTSRCEAFINRPTGKVLLEALDFAQLQFSKDFEAFLLGNQQFNFNDRMGGAYTQISRMLAKILWSGEMQKISAIFLNQDNEPPNFAELKLLAEYPNQDEAFCALQNILIQLLNKDQNDNQPSDIVASKDAISINEGACFDVATYYCQAYEYGRLYLKIINGQRFLEKTHGSHTLINLSPIYFNGIQLPKGSLFTTVNNDEFAFLRLTPLMFDNRQDMVSAFGAEIIKAEDLGGDLLKIINHDWYGY